MKELLKKRKKEIIIVLGQLAKEEEAKMHTSLSVLWNRLLEIYNEWDKNGSEECINDIKKCIENVYHDESLEYPEHLSVFLISLSENQDLKVAAEQASEKVGGCEKCVVCMGCAARFYEVIEEKNDERPLPVELENYFSRDSQIQYYLSAYENNKRSRDIKDSLLCLKGFSSSTPDIYSAVFHDAACVGGGFYLNVGGFGIAIDPGISFVENMHKHDIFIEDIHAVIVTHDHLDHNKDIGTLSSLLHDLNGYDQRRKKFFKDCLCLPDKKEESDKPRHSISWWLDEGTWDGHNDIEECITRLSLCTEWMNISEKIFIKAFSTEHMKKGKSYGIKIKISSGKKKTVIGYTSDTKFFPKLLEELQDSDILILNISDMYEKDVRGRKPKDSHLGYDGSLKILKDSKLSYRLAIVSEFCCTSGDYRVQLVKSLKEQAKLTDYRSVIAGEVGMQVSWADKKVFCSRCRRAESPENIVELVPEREFGKIEHICKKCRGNLAEFS